MPFEENILYESTEFITNKHDVILPMGWVKKIFFINVGQIIIPPVPYLLKTPDTVNSSRF